MSLSVRSKRPNEALRKKIAEEARQRAMQSLAEMNAEENRAITEAAMTDPDNPPLADDDQFNRLTNAEKAVYGDDVTYKLVSKGGRPRLGRTKQQIALRLDPEVITAFKAEGPGWQSRMNAALRKAAGLPEKDDA